MRQISIHKALCLGWRQELWLRVTCRRGAHTTTPGDRQWQMGTHHWNSWSRPSRAHTDRCLERCSGRGHIYQHSELSERKKKYQSTKVGMRKNQQQHSCCAPQAHISLKTTCMLHSCFQSSPRPFQSLLQNQTIPLLFCYLQGNSSISTV